MYRTLYVSVIGCRPKEGRVIETSPVRLAELNWTRPSWNLMTETDQVSKRRVQINSRQWTMSRVSRSL